jgi:L-iditol 2-dehydrogenase
MLAAVLSAVNDLRVQEVPTPAPGPGEVVVKVEANTICGTDVRILRGTKTSFVQLPVVLGHETAGRVAAVGPGVEGYEVGAAVAMLPAIPCRRCWQCRHDLENACATKRIMGYAVDCRGGRHGAGHGGRADRAAPPATGAAGRCPRGHREPAVGGPLGLGRAPRGDGDRRSDERGSRRGGPGGLRRCRGRRDHHLRRGARAGQPGAPAERSGGRVNIFAGLAGQGWAEVEANLIHYKQVVLTGTSDARRADYETALHLIETGRIDTAAMITHRFPLSALDDAFEAVISREAGKVAVLP